MLLGGCLMNKIYLESNRTMVDFVTFVRKTSIICLSKEIWSELHFSLESTNIRFSEIFGLNNTENNSDKLNLKSFMYHQQNHTDLDCSGNYLYITSQSCLVYFFSVLLLKNQCRFKKQEKVFRSKSDDGILNYQEINQIN